jgi:uncharacterized protein (DUF433 family)
MHVPDFGAVEVRSTPAPMESRQEYLQHPGRNVMTLARSATASWAIAGSPVLGYPAVMAFERITIDPAICTGKPCIRGLRFPVARLLGLLAVGETRETVLRNYPYLEPEDNDEALRYAAFLEPNIG